MVTTKNQPVSKEAEAPVKKFRSGSVTGTVWKNQMKLPDGTLKDTHNVVIERSYKDKKTEEWKTTNSYTPDALADVISVATESRKFLKLKEQ